MSRRFFKR
jgi:hypothetical protein